MLSELAEADIVLASTASPHPIVGGDELSMVMEQRGGRPLFLIDIAVPRDVDPLCAELPGVTLYDIDDLQAVVARNLQVRQAESRAADAIVEDEIKRFAGWLGSLEVLPTIAALRTHGEEIVESVLTENESRFDAEDRDRVRALARAVMQRLLHEPTLRMKGGADGRTHARMQLVRELFGLEDAEEAAPAEGEPADVRALRPARRRR
jgi:glutamyl-tRNA reductase